MNMVLDFLGITGFRRPGGVSAILLVLSCLPAAALSVAATAPVMVPNTPSGAGDPNAVVCRTPQHIAGSDQMGPQVCLHNSEWWKMAINGKDVAPDGKGLIDRPTVDRPRGEGDPDAVTCRTPRYGPKLCRTNRFWADVIKNHQMVTFNGEVVRRPLNTEFPSADIHGPLFGHGYDAPYDSGHVQSGQPLPGTP